MLSPFNNTSMNVAWIFYFLKYLVFFEYLNIFDLTLFPLLKHKLSVFLNKKVISCIMLRLKTHFSTVLGKLILKMKFLKYKFAFYWKKTIYHDLFIYLFIYLLSGQTFFDFSRTTQIEIFWMKHKTNWHRLVSAQFPIIY